MFQWIFGDKAEKAKTDGKRRSSKWPALEHDLISIQPYCGVCGITLADAKKRGGRLVGHHKKPFAKFPELELDPKNIFIICESRGLRDCHFLWGHLGLGWDHYNPDLDELAAKFHELVEQAKKTK